MAISKIFPVTCHTDRVGPGSKFVAIKGFKKDGHNFIDKAIESLCSSSRVKITCAKRHVSVDYFKDELRNKTRIMLNDFPSNKRGGRNPYIFVCAMLVAADKILAKENSRPTILTQRLVAQECQVAEYSLREHYLKLIKPHYLVNAIVSGK